MAAASARRKPIYTSYGNVAYDPAYDSMSGVSERSQPLVRPRERVAGRARVRVRPAGYVAPAAVLGFLLLGVVAMALVWNLAQLAATSDRLVGLRSDSSKLSQEYHQLVAQYELAFDLKTVEETVTASGAMVQPQPGQLITLDLSEPDSAQVYNVNQGIDTAKGLWDRLAGAVENIVAFFR